MPGSLQKSHKVSESREKHDFSTFMAFVSILWLQLHFHNKCSWNRSPNALRAHWSGDFQRAFMSGPCYRVQLPYKGQSDLTPVISSQVLSQRKSLAINLLRIFINYQLFSASEPGLLKADLCSMGNQLQLQRWDIHFYFGWQRIRLEGTRNITYVSQISLLGYAKFI